MWLVAGYKPSQRTFESLLFACSNKGDIKAAERVLTSMEEANVPVTQLTYQLLMSTLARAQAVQSHPSQRIENAIRAQELFSDMSNMPNFYDELLDQRLLNTYLNVFASGLLRRHSERCIELFAKYSLVPDQTTYTTLIKMYARLKDLPKVVSLLRTMREQGLAPTSHTYMHAILACVSKRNYTLALRYLKLMKDNGTTWIITHTHYRKDRKSVV